MAENKTDRRVRRTKRLLLESLTSLMKEKPIKDISVKELTSTGGPFTSTTGIFTTC